MRFGYRRLCAAALMAALASVAVVTTALSPTRTGVDATTSIPAYDHIFFVIEENHTRAQVLSGAPYLAGLANANAQSSTYFAVTHPSVNNYLALLSGQTYGGITDSCTVGSGTCHTGAVNLADEVESSGRTWKGYMETMPSPCYTPHDSGAYTERHNPFPYFDQIRTNPARCSRYVPYSQLAIDLGSAGTTPNYVWITPNLNDDMHDGTVAQGDNWAKANFPAIFNSPAWTTQHSLLVVTADEDDGSAGNNVIFFAVSSDGTTKTHYASTVHATHYSWARTIEAAWGLPTMTGNDAASQPMADLFTTGGPTSSPPPTPTATASPPPTATPSPTPSPTPTATSTPTAPPPPPPASIRAAFYYPWYPENFQSGDHRHPYLGAYDSGDLAVLRDQIAGMQYGHIQAGIASWWGQGSKTDSRVPALLNAAHGTGFQWSLYIESEGYADPTSPQIASDLGYIGSRYASDPSYLHVNGKPVIFVYADAGDACGMADRWHNADPGHHFYLVLKVFAGYTGCVNQPDSWHQYTTDHRTDQQGTYSFIISPGFWKYNESTPRLARDPAAFATACQQMRASGTQWQLIGTFNEEEESTGVERATEDGPSSSGWGPWLEALHGC